MYMYMYMYKKNSHMSFFNKNFAIIICREIDYHKPTVIHNSLVLQLNHYVRNWFAATSCLTQS